ncbi:MAG TPA: PqqD family protein [Alloacidobacterium sp.]|nr:PqqD family protein [Alloacidobacterium sp.]
MQVERTNSDSLVVQKLPDGSRVIVDSNHETVFALNATAGAAWDACHGPTTLSDVKESMQKSLNASVSEELAEAAILELQTQKLVKTCGPSPTRRQFIGSLGALALPLVVALPASEQRAYAQHARSAPPSHGTQPPPSNGGGIGGFLGWLLGLLGL